MDEKLDARLADLEKQATALALAITEIRGELRGTMSDEPLVAMEYVTVPAGQFIMGSKDDDPLAHGTEKPMRVACLPKYSIGKHLVTNALYRQFALATNRDWQAPESKDNHPAVNVSWHDAVAYCKWLTGQMRERGEIDQGHVVRLPSEAEWEKSARGMYGNIWPWGNEFDASRCNSTEGGQDGTTPVGAYSPQGDSPYGAADMAGNVWEWCSTGWQDSYEDYQDDNSPKGNAYRVLRGGAFFNIDWGVRCAVRFGFNPDLRYYYVGFRVVVAALL